MERKTIKPPAYVALFRGLIRCSLCGRKMHPYRRDDVVRYQCRSRDIAPGATHTDAHAATINVREDTLKACIDTELIKLFAPEHRGATLRALIDSQQPPIGDEPQRKREQNDIADAQRDARNLVEAVTKSGGSELLLEALARAE